MQYIVQAAASDPECRKKCCSLIKLSIVFIISCASKTKHTLYMTENDNFTALFIDKVLISSVLFVLHCFLCFVQNSCTLENHEIDPSFVVL